MQLRALSILLWLKKTTVRGGSRRKIGAVAFPKTFKSNLVHHDFVQFGKQHSRYRVISSSSSSIVLSQQFCEAYFISVTVAKLLWDLTTKYYWNSSPLKLLAGSAPDNNLIAFLDMLTTRSDHGQFSKTVRPRSFIQTTLFRQIMSV